MDYYILSAPYPIPLVLFGMSWWISSRFDFINHHIFSSCWPLSWDSLGKTRQGLWLPVLSTKQGISPFSLFGKLEGAGNPLPLPPPLGGTFFTFSQPVTFTIFSWIPLSSWFGSYMVGYYDRAAIYYRSTVSRISGTMTLSLLTLATSPYTRLLIDLGESDGHSCYGNLSALPVMLIEVMVRWYFVPVCPDEVM